ncbi:MAG: hypothetical protein Q8N51_16285, partial [Gammaproteobacteria bacterium]|nr:hypothetical protein [Gammaproteobacteria bacterium]
TYSPEARKLLQIDTRLYRNKPASAASNPHPASYGGVASARWHNRAVRCHAAHRGVSGMIVAAGNETLQEEPH